MLLPRRGNWLSIYLVLLICVTFISYLICLKETRHHGRTDTKTRPWRLFLASLCSLVLQHSAAHPCCPPTSCGLPAYTGSSDAALAFDVWFPLPHLGLWPAIKVGEHVFPPHLAILCSQHSPGRVPSQFPTPVKVLFHLLKWLWLPLLALISAYCYRVP